MAGIGKVKRDLLPQSRLIPEYETKFIILSISESEKGKLY